MGGTDMPAVRGYELQERVGTGGFGEVYRAYQPSVGRQVAIKIILPQYASHPDFVRRFESEARLIARLEHPHIVPLYDYWRDADTGGAYLVMRWLRGGSLYESLQRGAWSPEEAAQLLDQIAGALAAAHRKGVVHRDVKPENILLDEDRNAYLSDFGIAKDVLRATPATAPDAIPGSLLYISPEAAQGQAVTPQSDQYSLGVVMYEVLTGVHPFPDSTPATLLAQLLNEPLPPLRTRRPDLPGALEEVIGRATAKEPAGRYPDAPSFAAAFRDTIFGTPDRVEVKTEISVELPAFLAAEAEDEEDEWPVFVARERKLERLDGFLRSTLAGEGKVVFITGGPGRGKTALMSEFARQAMEAHPDLLVASGACNAYSGVGDPYLPFREVMGLLTGDVESGWAAGRITRDHARRLWDTMPVTLPVLMDRGPHLVDVLVPGAALLSRARAAGNGAPWMEEMQRTIERRRLRSSSFDQSHLFQQLTNTLQALAEVHPLLLTLDDLQWADTSSIGLLFHLGRHLEGTRVLIVAAYRPEEVALGRDEAHSGERVRHPLDKALSEFKRRFGDVWVELGKEAAPEGRRFVDALLATEPNRLGEDFRSALSRHTGGHPLFTVELLRAMQERGDLVQDEAGRWAEGPALDWETLPPRVEGAIGERIGRLPLALQEVLKVASVEGEEFTAEVVAWVQGVAELDIIRQLSGTLDRQHRLVWGQGSRRLSPGGRRAGRASHYRFRHFLFQRYLYNRLDEGERVYLHEAVGDALEGLYGEGAEEVAGRLARHYQEAGITEKAIHYLQQAGERAVQLSAYQEGRAHLTKALALLETLPDAVSQEQRLERAEQELALQLSLGIACWAIYSAYPEAVKAYTRARELCQQTGKTSQLCTILGQLAFVHYVRAEYQQARELEEEALNLAQQAEDPLLVAMGHWRLGCVLFALGEYTAARAHLEQMIAFYEPHHHQALVSLSPANAGPSAMAYEACCLWCLGYPDQAQKRGQEALARARELDHPFTLGDVLSYGGCLLSGMRRDAQALKENAEELIRLARGTDMVWWVKGTLHRGEAVAMLGQVQEGMVQMREGIAAFHTIGARTLLSGALGSLAEAQAKAGQPEEGLATLTEALALMEETDERHWEAELYRLKGELLSTQGDEAAAEASLQKAVEVARRQEAKSWELRATMSLARLWQEQGRTDKARQMLAEIYGWFTEGFDTLDLKEARALLDELSQNG